MRTTDKTLHFILFVTFLFFCRPTCAAGQSGWVIYWGGNSSGAAAGTVSNIYEPSVNTLAVGGQMLSKIVSVAAGGSHGLALKEDGTVVGWGWNFYGQATVPAGLSNVIAIAAGENYSLALKQDGTVIVWGQDGDYHLTNAPMSLNSVVAISTGTTHAIALKNDGTLIGWGVPKTPLGLSNIVAVAAGSGYYSDNLALKKNGRLVEWRANGNETAVPNGITNIIAVAAAENYCIALNKNGIVNEWDNASRQSSEILSNVTAIATFANYNLALKNDGTVIGWGHGRFYPRTVPAGLSNVIAIAVGGDFCLAITTNRAVADKFRH